MNTVYTHESVRGRERERDTVIQRQETREYRKTVEESQR